jgi:hypothetical protein
VALEVGYLSAALIMWLFTNLGFFSVVQEPADELLTIRARVASDLDNLKKAYLPELSPIVEEAQNDYPFTARVSHEKFAAALEKISKAIHYGNFKAEISVKMGKRRAQIYSKVWHGLLELQKDE